ncbi:iron(III) transport system substrate-binding protein [Deinococcus metalli]|uniref:Iron(III) transport system substrate-binding protein n=1 Tax=Deinococcus metalli TaxID=1141878 RepID=A0A7W8KI92_9DEIO|nr:extracellular solute-binding protein [Deinococcus metalli]MBB5378686.1 iron(III) transport system substrate-binding protein [Deinococcus metalli]GHF61702.1 iron(III)-binding protein [Deinococcus metalli]
MNRSILLLSALCLTATASAQTPAPIVMYSAIGYAQNVIDAFTKKTGIPVKMVDLSTGPLVAKVQAEKQNPQWNVVWFDGAEAMRDLANQNMLLKGWEPDVKWNALSKQVRPADKAYIPGGVTLAGVFIVNTKLVPDSKMPVSWAELSKPEWKGLVGMPNPAVSGPTYPLVAGLMQAMGGEAQGKAVLSSVKANGLQVFDTNGPMIKQLLSGGIAIAAAQSTRAVDALIKKEAVKVVYPKGVSLLPSDFGISAKASPAVQDSVKKFIEFFLSPEGQAAALNSGDSDGYFYPLVDGVSANALATPIEKVAFLKVDPLVWGPREAEINTWFANTIAR